MCITRVSVSDLKLVDNLDDVKSFGASMASEKEIDTKRR